jgi:hypothetical protein
MAETTTTQQIVREAPEIEAYKLDLLKQAKGLAFNEGRTPLAEQLPGYNVAGFAPAQQTAMNAAISQGIGAFDPLHDRCQPGSCTGLQPPEKRLMSCVEQTPETCTARPKTS